MVRNKEVFAEVAPTVEDFSDHVEALLVRPNSIRTRNEARGVVRRSIDFLARSRPSVWSAGKVIYWQGYPAERIYMVTSGFAYLSVMDEEGNDRARDILGPTAIVGGEAVSGFPDYANALKAVTDCTVKSVSVASLTAVNERALVEFFTVNHYLQQERWGKRAWESWGQSVEARVANTLLDLTDRKIPFPLRELNLPLLAGLVNSQRATVNKILTMFREDKIAVIGRTVKEEPFIKADMLEQIVAGRFEFFNQQP